MRTLNHTTVKTHPTTFDAKNAVVSLVRTVYPLNPCGGKISGTSASIRYYGCFF